MELEDKVQAVEQLWLNLDKEIASFQNWSGLHCKTGCGKCCLKPNIEASVLEFLPFALYLYKQNIAFDWLEKINGLTDTQLCALYDPTSTAAGMCSQYAYRALICRLFGFSARRNKYAMKEIVMCQTIKTEQPEQFAVAVAQIQEVDKVPLVSYYYMQLREIDDQLAQEFFPINRAIKKAIETILHYYAYRS